MSALNETPTNSWLNYPPLRNPLIAGCFALLAFILEYIEVIGEDISMWVYLITIGFGGYIWAKEGIEEVISEYEIGIPILMIGATIGAMYLGMWDEAAALVVLYGIAEGIEEYTFNRTRNAIRSLLDLAPKQARVIRDGKEHLIPAEEMNKDDEFVVLPGESVPTDGIILKGATSLDEALVTGESIPVNKKPGDKVFPATINGQATITVKATSTFADNTLSRIIDLVENAQEQKGRAQAWMERFGHRYSPAILLISITMVLAPLFIQLDAAYWIEKAVILLVTAAPCALVISLPIAMASGISGSARRGILIKGGAHLEHLGTIKTIAMDKTGTLTHGKPNVTDVIALQGSEDTIIGLASGLEQYSSHPLALAIVKYAKQQQMEIASAHDTEAIFGSGVKGTIDSDTWYLGNPKLFLTMGIELGEHEVTIDKLQSEGKTVVLLGNNQQITGIIAIQDTIRENAIEVIKRLHTLGIRTVMLTGDNQRTAHRIASELGIDDVRAGLKPEDKVAAVQDLMKDGSTLMVGDGVNDAPALATATCGMAMGAAGSDAAIEAADIALMADDLSKIEEAMQIGQKARYVSKQNILFSIIVLAILIPAGVGGFITIAVAVLVHEASELMAVANGLRAGRFNRS
ncbi:heavy metal translocating P-type ATPase [Cycloclasticus zancles]|uniref:P-type Zn(2+) transporter n=1 Tax=Cycloclasticus zancles 78-ME TaxID=1198232 RepID=S5T4H2_9GAMM|nr:cation-translocating P-type ATPase [Cycloclasticus zancles]AGS38479.1 Cadmium-transporting P-type ATPase [Cycloclasticus zancles 78-ME]